MTELLRPEQAAVELGVSRTRIYALIKSGDLRSIKLGKSRLVPVQCIREFVAQQLEAQSADART